MKKLLFLSAAFMLIAGASFADNGKKNKKKCAKGKSCCQKSCTKKKTAATTVTM